MKTQPRRTYFRRPKIKGEHYRETQAKIVAIGQRNVSYEEARPGFDCFWPAWGPDQIAGPVCGLPVNDAERCYCAFHRKKAGFYRRDFYGEEEGSAPEARAGRAHRVRKAGR